MKILFVSQVPNSRLMGVPRVLYSVGDEMAKRGHSVDYFFEEDGPKPFFSQAALMEWAVRIAPEIAWRCRRKRYDLVVATTATGWCLSYFRKALLPPKTRLVSWHHGFEALMWEQMQAEEQLGGISFSRRFKLYYNTILWANRLSIETQDAALFTSTEERDWVRTRMPRHAHKAVYLPNGVSANYYYPNRFESSSFETGAVQQASNHQNPRLLFVGYWDPWRKGRKYLTEAYPRILERFPGARLSLVGTKLSADRILPDFPPEARDSIDVIPQIDEPTLVETYRNHDIFLLPALFEGMPLVVLEAMASAMPVITTANNGMRDLITHYENGLLIPRRDSKALAESVCHLIENPDLRQKLGLAAYETVSRLYTWRQVSDIFEENMFRILHNRLQNPMETFENA